jgi:hypothetical protein
MNRLTSITLIVALSATLSTRATAQWNAARFDTDRNRVYTTFGLDPALVTTVGYARVTRPFGHPVQLSIDAGLAAAHIDTRDFRARLGAQSTIVRAGAIRLTGSATFITRGTENAIYRALDFGAAFSGTLGVYRRGWYAAGEFGFDKAIITHLTHTDWYRRNFYPDAKDGWYLDAGGVFNYGLATGLNLGRMELGLRAGWRRTENFKQLLTPVYGTLGVGYAF